MPFTEDAATSSRNCRGTLDEKPSLMLMAVIKERQSGFNNHADCADAATTAALQQTNSLSRTLPHKSRSAGEMLAVSNSTQLI
jgi:hypothetical protein